MLTNNKKVKVSLIGRHLSCQLSSCSQNQVLQDVMQVSSMLLPLNCNKNQIIPMKLFDMTQNKLAFCSTLKTILYHIQRLVVYINKYK